jgi:hypothetical protein
MLNWPPDVFGICGYLLRMFGGYHRVLQKPWPPHDFWAKEILIDAEKWSKNLSAPPENIERAWQSILDCKHLDIRSIRDNLAWCSGKAKQSPSNVTKSNTKSSSPSDDLNDTKSSAETEPMAGPPNTTNKCRNANEAQAFLDALVRIYTTIDELAPLFLDKWWVELNAASLDASLKDPSTEEEEVRTLAKQLDRNIIRVLPKSKSPQVGISVRSLTNHLCFWTSLEVEPAWKRVGATTLERLTDRTTRGSNLFLLLVPWPFTIERHQFGRSNPANEINLADGFGFFEYRVPSDVGALIGNIEALSKSAIEITGRVDGIILPEGATSLIGYESLKSFLATKAPFSVVGVCDNEYNSVHSIFKVPEHNREERNGAYFDTSQSKHHRWKLDGSQILQYGLQTRLDLDTEWWESNSMGARELRILDISGFLIATLVCEDLARQDPVSDLLRTLGPNLVISILMDGPQITQRWSARYATVLADDPGSSVLTITSIGMMNLCVPRENQEVSRSIALWRDSVSGTHECKLEPDSQALLLQLDLTDTIQHTADRRRPIRTITPVLKKIHQIKA